MPKGARSLLLVAGFAIATVLAADALIGRLVPIVPAEYEPVDALQAFARGDPDVLVLGSSYARSFLPLADWYAKQSPPVEMVVAPVEGGKFVAYDWLLQHRLRDLVEETDAHGRRVRSHLKHLVLVINYWDICTTEARYPNLPARVWGFEDYVRDLFTHGATAYNANYVDQRFAEATRWSVLITDRGPSRIMRMLHDRISPRTEDSLAGTESIRLGEWRKMILHHDLAGPACVKDEQLAAFDRTLAFAKAHGMRVSMVLWALIPKSQEPETLAVTDRFKAFVADRAAPLGIAVDDLQAANILDNADFRPDLDHLRPSGNQKVLDWARTGPFANLKPAAAMDAGRAASGGGG